MLLFVSDNTHDYLGKPPSKPENVNQSNIGCFQLASKLLRVFGIGFGLVIMHGIYSHDFF